VTPQRYLFQDEESDGTALTADAGNAREAWQQRKLTRYQKTFGNLFIPPLPPAEPASAVVGTAPLVSSSSWAFPVVWHQP